MTAPLSQATVDRLRRLCAVHTMTAAAEIVGCSITAVGEAKRRGWKAGRGHPPRRPRPGDFVIQANLMTKVELQAHYRTGQYQIDAWLVGIDRQYTPRRSSVPRKQRPSAEDMAALIAQMGVTAAAKHLGVTQVTFMLWRQAAGLPVDRKRKTRVRERQATNPRIGWVERYVAEMRA